VKQVSKIESILKIRKTVQKTGTIGFVPTMGAFHEGHLSLMRKAKLECDFVIVSLFVNPLQFGQKEDLTAYPRTLSEDREKAATIGVDLLWTPTEAMLFPPGFQTTIKVSEISHRWEGASRPGHFEGVATIVAKFLQIVRPTRLYLGQKDYQQVSVIRQMITDLHFETKVRVLPIMREKDGLAMSSRNRRLSLTDRAIASVLHQALRQADKIVQEGEKNTAEILTAVKIILESTPRIVIEYIALCDATSLEPIAHLEKEGILLVAVRLASVRLIDNELLINPNSLNSDRSRASNPDEKE